MEHMKLENNEENNKTLDAGSLRRYAILSGKNQDYDATVLFATGTSSYH